MKITLIGGSGFVGTRLLDLLGQKNYDLQNIDKQQSHFFSNVTILGDVRDKDKLTEQLRGVDVVILLAAEHRDDVTPISKNPDEEHPKDPFNHYGKSKWLAEMELEKWYRTHPDWNINILRPTVIFGERNRGNVYNLLKQIAGGKFAMVGKGENKKSMAYVGNIVALIKFLIENKQEGYNVYNYIDKPDFTMNELVAHVSKVLNRHIPATHFPYWLGMAGGYCFDMLAWILRKKLTVSSVRVKKFCATTQFDASKVAASGFRAPYTLGEGLARTLEFEFVHPRQDDITFKSE